VSLTIYGYEYVLGACADGAACKMALALHGCTMSAADIGDAFIDDTYLNQYADTNNLVILYPQVSTTDLTATHWAARTGGWIPSQRCELRADIRRAHERCDGRDLRRRRLTGTHQTEQFYEDYVSTRDTLNRQVSSLGAAPSSSSPTLTSTSRCPAWA
jgi:hypothetical protein